MSVVHAVVHVLLKHLLTHSLGAATFAPSCCLDLYLTDVNQKPLTAVDGNPDINHLQQLAWCCGNNC